MAEQVDDTFLQSIGFPSSAPAGTAVSADDIEVTGSSTVMINGEEFAIQGASPFAGASVDEDGTLSLDAGGFADYQLLLDNELNTSSNLSYEIIEETHDPLIGPTLTTAPRDSNGRRYVRINSDDGDIANWYEENDLNAFSNIFDPITVSEDIKETEELLDAWANVKANQLQGTTHEFGSTFDVGAADNPFIAGWQNRGLSFAQNWSNLISDTFGGIFGEDWVNWREGHANDAAFKQQFVGDYITRWDDVNPYDPQSIKNYYLGLAGGAAPDLLALGTGTLLAPVTGGASLYAATGFVFSSHLANNYAEQAEDNKNLALAIGTATVQTGLDRLGFSFLKGIAPFTKAGRDGAIKKIMSQFGVGPKKAAQILTAIIAEGLTEGGQEYATALQAKFTGREYEAGEIWSTVKESMIAGGLIGGGVRATAVGGGGIREFAQAKQEKWAREYATRRVLEGLSDAPTEGTEAAANSLRQQLTATLETKSIEELNAEYDAISKKEEGNFFTSLTGFGKDPVGATQRVLLNLSREPAVGIINQLDRDNVPIEKRKAIYRAMKLYLETDEAVGTDYDFSRKASLIGGQFSSVILNNKMRLAQALGLDGLRRGSKVTDTTPQTDAVFKAYVQYRKNPEGYAGPHKKYFDNPVLADVYDRMTKLAKKADAKYSELIVGYQGVDDYLSNMFQFDKSKIRKDPERLAKLLAEERGEFFSSNSDIKGFIDSIIDSETDASLEGIEYEYLSKSGGLKRKGNLDLGNADKIKAEFGRDDIFDAFSDGINNNIRYGYQRKYIGDNNIVLRTALANAREELGDAWRDMYGATIELSADRHTHRKPIPKALKIFNAWMGSLNIAIYLEGALISSTPESMLSTHGMTELQDKVNALALQQKEVPEVVNAMKLMPDTMYSSLDDDTVTNAGSSLNKQTRAYAQHGGATSKADFDGAVAPYILQQMNSLTMMPLAKYTNWTKMVALTIGKTAIASDLMMLNGITSLKGKELDKAQAMSAKNLQLVGLDPVVAAAGYKRWNDMASEIVAAFPIDPESSLAEQAKMQSQQAEARDAALEADPEMNQFLQTINAANIVLSEQYIVFPSVSNRPLFYSNPYLKVITQFQGFISTFTNKVIPRLWNDTAGKRGPEMTYNAFQTIVLMMAMSALSGELKEELYFGGEGYDDTVAKKTRSAIEGSGLLGVYSRPISVIFPKFDEGKGLIGKTIDEVLGINKHSADKAYQAIDAYFSGDTERAGYHASSFIPFLGNVRSWREDLSGYELRR